MSMTQFLKRVEEANDLASGLYLLSFFADNEMGISFSVILKNKKRLQLVNNKLMWLNRYNVFEIRFKFDIKSFCYSNFGVTFDEYIVYAPKEKLKLFAEALNNVYLYSAKIPTNLL